jgi:hypothetical protein
MLNLRSVQLIYLLNLGWILVLVLVLGLDLFYFGSDINFGLQMIAIGLLAGGADTYLSLILGWIT